MERAEHEGREPPYREARRVPLIPDRRTLAETERREHEARTTAGSTITKRLPPPLCASAHKAAPIHTCIEQLMVISTMF